VTPVKPFYYSLLGGDCQITGGSKREGIKLRKYEIGESAKWIEKSNAVYDASVRFWEKGFQKQVNIIFNIKEGTFTLRVEL
jgi:hypothetical protein